MTMKVVVVSTEMHEAEQYIAGLMQQEQFEIVDTRQYAYSWREWAQEANLRQAFPGRYHVAGRYFWNPHFEPVLLIEGIQRLKARLARGKEIILLAHGGVHEITLSALRGAVDAVEISAYNGVVAVEAKQQAMF